MSFSIVIPALNEQDFICNLLRCLCRQSLKASEIVVVDGGSTDRTIAVLSRFAKKLPLFLVRMNHSRKGISRQRNIGARLARWNWVCFIDADVRFGDDFLEKLFDEINSAKAVAATTRVSAYPEDERLADKIIYGLTNFLVVTLGIGGKGNVTVARRDVFFRAGCYNEAMAAGEDSEIFSRLKRHGAIVRSRLLAYESPRRFRKNGYVGTAIAYCLDYLSGILFKKSLSRSWLR